MILKHPVKHDKWYASMNLATVYYNMGSYDSSLFYAKYALAKITQSTSRATAIKVLYI